MDDVSTLLTLIVRSTKLGIAKQQRTIKKNNKRILLAFNLMVNRG